MRREQFSTIARRSPMMAACSLGSFLMTAVTFWTSASHVFLLGILAVLTLLHGSAVMRSSVWLKGSQNDLSELQKALRVLLTVLVALTWASVIVVLMPSASVDQRQLLIYVSSGLTASGILLSPMLPAALAMTATTTAAVLAATPFVHQTISVQHSLMVILFFVMIVVSSVIQNKDFRRRVESESTARAQKETIGVLLKEFEDSASDWLWESDDCFRLLTPSARLCTVLSCSSQDLEGLDLRSLVVSDDSRHARDIAHFRAAVQERRSFREVRVPLTFGGRQYLFCLSGHAVFGPGGAFLGHRGVASDMTDAQRSSDRIAFLASYDSLTGLPNRFRFHEALENATRGDGPFALLCLDLDGFKPVNDTYGHSVGDELLVLVSKRLCACTRKKDSVARLGGDEFGILLLSSDPSAPQELANRLIASVGEPFLIRDLQINVSLSVGVVSAHPGTTPEELLQAGDIALYASKHRGRGICSIFEQSMADIAQERHLLQAALRAAIEEDGLTVAFQPIIDSKSRRVRCVEALARWEHPEFGTVTPDRFIPLAEENGLIVALGAWVLRRACAEAATWPSDVRIAVNLSPLQVVDTGLIAMIDAVLQDTGLAPERLEIEITESVFLDDTARTLGVLKTLHARGIRIALDDFGTGYSSLSYLRSFPFDKVKIDRSFVRDVNKSDEAVAIVRAIIGMASSLGMSTTGEGIETEQQAAMLDHAGCDEVQGFFFGRPCSGEEIASVIKGMPSSLDVMAA